MAHILLTGAGFSRNWGGWLADEVFEYLLADPDITPGIRTQLWADRRAGGNYETTVQALRDRALKGDDADFKKINSMLGGMFNAMKNAFNRMGFQFDHTTDRPYQITQFLHRFDWIFTLNQDTLLERHYFTTGFQLSAHPRWQGFDVPGLEHLATAAGSPLDTTSNVVAKADGFSLHSAGYQPYIKLHGSHNWLASRTSGLLLITGGNKETDISSSPLLAWYNGLFETALCHPAAKVMVIGYSFSDEHINKTILRAKAAGAKFFIIDPAGVDVIDKRKVGSGATYNLFDELPQSIIGASRRPLSSIFGYDSVEFNKVNGFFA
ncbi:hypothetical protein ABIF90_001089 [Bradyrhizobium japonicum]